MLRLIRNSFIAGLLLLTPLAATIFVLNLLRERIGRPINSFLFYFLDPSFKDLPGMDFVLDLAAISVVALCITILGFLSNYVIGRVTLRFGEWFIAAVPIMGNIYKTVKQIVETFSKQKKAVFQEVVLTEYPRKGVYALGFLTSEAKGEVQSRTNKSVVNVFIPTTPNPTSGYLLMVPKDQIISMDMSIGDGMKLIVSGGAVSPKWTAKAKKTASVRVRNPKTVDA